MKVQELRQLLSGVDRTLLEKAFVESYKQFSKAKKEEVDLLIQEILEGKEVKKTDKNAVLDFDAFEQEVLDFIANAKAQNYLAPNRIIPKNQRSKWRFLVKNYIKALEKIQLEDPNYDRAVILLEAIYKLMCHENINNICDFILLVYFVLAEPEEGVKYYFKNCRESNKEIILYRALDLVDWADGDDKLWIDIYKYGLKVKVKPRDSLREEYKARLAK